MFIHSRPVDSPDREAIPVINPATEEIIGEAPRGTPQDAISAVEAASRAFLEWRRTPAIERAAALRTVADDIRAHHDELVRLLTMEEGKPLPENEEEVWWTEETFDYYAGIALQERGKVIPSVEEGQFNFVLKEPWGVVACLIPYNYPLLLMAWKAAPALAAGNTVVIKPSELTPLSTLRLAEAAFSHLPSGVANLVTGYGKEVGEPLVSHPDVRMVAFTGSYATGQRIASQAAPQMKKLHLELSGKDPMVIAPDVEIQTAVRGLSYAALINAGQVCTSTERVYVHESILPQFVEQLADFVGELRLGNGLEEGIDVGPLIREPFRQRVADQVEAAVKAGAKPITGGKSPNHLERGFFYEPTVLVNVDHSMAIMRAETMGPVMPIMPYKTFDEAIALANDSDYGLGASLMSNDPRLVRRFFDGVQAGTIWINDPLTDNFAGPFGGMKMSGLGRELGQEGYDQFCQVKHVHWDVDGGMKSYWYPY